MVSFEPPKKYLSDVDFEIEWERDYEGTSATVVANHHDAPVDRILDREDAGFVIVWNLITLARTPIKPPEQSRDEQRVL
jgi:hypothetical protein